MPAFSTALAFFDGYRHERLPANLLQVMRLLGYTWQGCYCYGTKRGTTGCKKSQLKEFKARIVFRVASRRDVNLHADFELMKQFYTQFCVNIYFAQTFLLRLLTRFSFGITSLKTDGSNSLKIA